MASACSAHPHPGQRFPDLRENCHYYVYVYNAGVGSDTCVPWYKSGGQGITFGSQLSYHLGFQGSLGLGSKYLYLLNHVTGQNFKLNVHACLYLYVGRAHVEAKGQLEVGSLFLPCGSWGSDLDHQLGAVNFYLPKHLTSSSWFCFLFSFLKKHKLGISYAYVCLLDCLCLVSLKKRKLCITAVVSQVLRLCLRDTMTLPSNFFVVVVCFVSF